MEYKKHPTKEISKYRLLFLLVGIVISLSLVLAAFEYKTPFNSPEAYILEESGFILPDIPPTIHQEPKPPQPKQYTVREILEEEDIEDLDIEIDIDFKTDDVFEEPLFIDTNTDEPTEPTPFIVLEKEASFPGDRVAWYKFLKKNLKYPKRAQRAGIEGKVFLKFYVDAQGNISDIEVTRGIGGGCDEEAIRVLKKSPKWNPGMQRGRPVKSPMSIFVVFKLK